MSSETSNKKEKSSSKKLFNEFPPISTKDWEEQIQKDLKGRDYESTLLWQVDEGLKVSPYYRADNNNSVGKTDPADFDFNPSPIKKRKSLASPRWEIRQDINEASVSASNAKARKLFEAGADGLCFVIDSEIENNAEHTRDKNVCEINNAKDMQELLRDIDFNKKKIHFRSDIKVLEQKIAPLLVQQIKEKNCSKNDFHGHLDYDLFDIWLKQGYLTYSLEDTFSTMKSLVDYCSEELPQTRCLRISDTVFHNCGVGPIESLGLMLASAHELLVMMTAKNNSKVSPISFEKLLPRLWFQMSISSSYLLEIARFRAMRIIWPQLVRAYNPNIEEDSSLLEIHIHGSSSLYNKTIFDSYSNVLRGSTESMAAIIGTCDSFSANPYNINNQNKKFRPAMDNERGERLACSMQLIHRYESYFDKVIDPAAGSYYLENLSDLIAKKAWAYFQEVEQEGGLLKMIRNSKLAEKIKSISKKKLEQVASSKITVIGTNQFPPPYTEDFPDDFSDELLAPPKSKLGIIKRKEQVTPLVAISIDQEFAKLRLATIKHIKKGKLAPQVILLSFGNVKLSEQKLKLARNFFSCLGYSIIEESSVGAMAKALSEDVDKVIFHIQKEYRSTIISLCGDDLLSSKNNNEHSDYIDNFNKKLYEEIARLDENKIFAPLLSLVGKPSQNNEQELKDKSAFSIFSYIYFGMNLLEELKRYQEYFKIKY